MAKFSGSGGAPPRMATPTSPIRSTTVPAPTALGGLGYERDAKSELFTLAVANMVGEDTFHEGAAARDNRFAALVRQVALEDPDWVARFVPYLRNEMQMRSASVVMAAEYAAALRGGPMPLEAPTIRSVIDSACVRADEPAELLGYWLQTHGRNIPSAVKRGLSDAAARLYTEKAALKYDGGSRSVRMGDVIELAHAVPKAPWQSELYKWLLDTRHNRSEPRRGELLRVLHVRAQLESMPVTERRKLLTSPDGKQLLAESGMTWEALSGWLQGPMDAAAWEAVIPSMGYMALLRNLRNFDQAGISKATQRLVAAKLADPEQVARSRQFPFRFLSAYKAVEGNLHWAAPLEDAVNESLSNVPALPGSTLVLCDWSGSMWAPLSARSDLQRAEAATLFGVTLAKRSNADLVTFGTSSHVWPIAKGSSVLPLVRQAHSMGGTDTHGAVQRHYRGHDRVIVVTDEQHSSWGDPYADVPSHVPVYTFNVAGYRTASTQTTRNRHTFAGLTDKAFVMLPLLEARQNAGWPF